MEKNPKPVLLKLYFSKIPEQNMILLISKITQFHFHYKDRFNNVFTAVLWNYSFIKMFSQLNIAFQVQFLCSFQQTSQLHTQFRAQRQCLNANISVQERNPKL